ncbi:MAG: hypothetical protein KC550_06085 [Nanoarchaeota archaeon]|nr:hypothetical protein [Nanoarchaeota archaeon]
MKILNNIFLICVLSVFSLFTLFSTVYADSNGVWILPSDVRPGIFGSDEVSGDYIFPLNVYFYSKLISSNSSYYVDIANGSFFNRINSNLLFSSVVQTSEICLGGVCKTNWSDLGGSTLSNPPVCSGVNKALQWNGLSWDCQIINSSAPPACLDSIWNPNPNTICSGNAFTQTSNCANTRPSIGTRFCPPPPACSDECAFNGQRTCSGNNALTCGNYDADACLEWNAGVFCANGCSGGTCNLPPPAWYVSHHGSFYGTLLSTSSSSKVRIDVSNTGVITGIANDYWYVLNVAGVGSCVYGKVNNPNYSVIVTPTLGPAGCPNTGLTITRAEAQASGAVLMVGTYNVLGNMNAAGALTATWTTVSGGLILGPLNGQGAAAGNSLTLNWIDSYGNARSTSIPRN